MSPLLAEKLPGLAKLVVEEIRAAGSPVMERPWFPVCPRPLPAVKTASGGRRGVLLHDASGDQPRPWGRVTTKTDPLPGWLRTEIVPPWFSTIP